MTCPHCGAAARIGLDGLPESYRCGSDVMRDESVEQSKPCRELCYLREWREAVLWNAECAEVDPWKRDRFKTRVIVEFNIEVESGSARDMFDAEIKKEIG